MNIVCGSDSQRGRTAVFATGFFSLSQVPMMTLLVPLWAIQTGAEAFWIGLLIAARGGPAVLFSIQAGALMDRQGATRIMMLLGTVGAGLTLLYPLISSMGILLVLQAVVGFMHVCCWIGAQSLIGAMTRGDPALMGRFTFITTLGSFMSPLLAGIAWEHLGSWGAFIMASVWSLVLVAVTSATSTVIRRGSAEPPRFADWTPRWSDYAAGFGLLRNAFVACIIILSAALAGTYAIRHAFLVVYLDSIMLKGTEIGLIVGTVALSASIAGLVVGRLSRTVSSHWLVLLATILAASVLCLYPFFTDFRVLMLIACATGLFSGIAFPLILSLLTRGVLIENQGLGVGLRASTNRMAALVIPVVMGAIVSVSDLTWGIVIMAVIIVAVVIVVGLFLARSSRTGMAPAGEGETRE